MERRKKIEKVQFIVMPDDDPDLSWLGEYTDEVDDWVIDRAEDEYVSVLRKQTARIHRYEDCAWIEDGDVVQLEDATELQVTCPECRSELGLSALKLEDRYEIPSRGHEYRFFKPYIGGDEPKGAWTEEQQRYGKQDYERMEGYSRGDWHMTRCYARATYVIYVHDEDYRDVPCQCGHLQEMRSSGLGGVESDCGEYIEEVKADELADLRDQLEAIGFSKEEIDAAFEHVEEVEK